MQVFVLLLMAIVFIFIHYPLPAIALLAIITFIRATKERRAEIERYNIQLQKEAARQKYFEEQKEKEARKKEEEKERDAEIERRIIRGEDACRKCKTIHPKRCSCGRCLVCHSNWLYSDTECKICWTERMEYKCRQAEKAGHAVCHKHFIIDPPKCTGGCGDFNCCCGSCDD